MNVREKLVELIAEAKRQWEGGTNNLDGRIVDHLIANGVTVQEWISVKDRLPEEKGEYLVTYHPCWWDDVKLSNICVGVDTFRGKTTWARNKFQRVTHWMPLPQPPKGE